MQPFGMSRCSSSRGHSRAGRSRMHTRRYRLMSVDMCTEMCMNVGIDMSVDVCTDMCINVCIDMGVYASNSTRAFEGMRAIGKKHVWSQSLRI